MVVNANAETRNSRRSACTHIDKGGGEKKKKNMDRTPYNRF